MRSLLAIASFMGCATFSLHAATRSIPSSIVATKLANVLISEREIERQESGLMQGITDLMQQNNTRLLERLALFVQAPEQKQDFIERFEALSKTMVEDFQQRAKKELRLSGFLRETAVEVYSAEFSGRELIQLGRFFSSSVGKKYLQKTPSILQTMIEETQTYIVPQLLDLQRDVQMQFRERAKQLHSEYVDP